MSESKANDPGGSESGATPADAGDEHVDGCVESIDLDENEATLDVELPPARGGVEQPDLPRS